MNPDLDVIRERLVADVLDRHGKIAPDAVLRDHTASQEADGSWQDIDYADDKSVDWTPMEHLRRIRSMLLALRAGNPGNHNPACLADSARRGLHFWCRRDPRSRNWWHNQIGAPLELGALLLLQENEDGCIAAAGPILERSGWFLLKEGNLKEAKTWTGANLIWMAANMLTRAVLERNAGLVTEACRYAAEEIRIAGKGDEGIQTDMSYHQHGPLLYNGSYGASFCGDCVRLLRCTHGTSWQFPEACYGLLTRFLLEGQQWMMCGPIWDYSCLDRCIARPMAGRIQPLADPDYFAFLDGRRAEELQSFAVSFGRKDGAPFLPGNRHFWNSDFMVHRRPGYSTSVRMSSTRTRASECCNDEGKLSHHLADGLTYLYKTGREYRDIFPVWDWQKLPGTTCGQGKLEPMTGLEWFMGGSSRVGGVSDGTYGLAAQELAREDVSALKAWFYFDEAWICLGAAITGSQGSEVATSLEQCWLDGEIWVEDADSPQASGTFQKAGSGWAWHAGTGYVLYDAAAWTVRAGVQKGSWRRIGPQSDAPVEGAVFSLWIDHGKADSKGSYAYAVFPEADRARLREELKSGTFEVLANSETLQAVWQKESGIVQAAFWQEGELAVPGLGLLQADRPCLVLLRPLPETGNMQASVSSVGTGGDEVRLRFAAFSNARSFEETIALPSGLRSGESVVRHF